MWLDVKQNHQKNSNWESISYRKKKIDLQGPFMMDFCNLRRTRSLVHERKGTKETNKIRVDGVAIIVKSLLSVLKPRVPLKCFAEAFPFITEASGSYGGFQKSLLPKKLPPYSLSLYFKTEEEK